MIVSLIHIIAAVVALATAALVLWLPKGTRLHKQIGYIFVIALLLLNGSAAFIYNLTGSVNFLHIFIVVSLCSMLSGMYPAIRRSSDQWLVRHIRGMNGAAIGVWAAGLAEFTVRVLPFYLSSDKIIAAGIGIGVLAFFVIWFGNYYFLKRQHLYR